MQAFSFAIEIIQSNEKAWGVICKYWRERVSHLIDFIRMKNY
jgi:hypothetical protein